jgi:hypothetical protein
MLTKGIDSNYATKVAVFFNCGILLLNIARRAFVLQNVTLLALILKFNSV